MRAFSLMAGIVLGSGLLASALSGCGSATNNDQGTSFSLLGYFTEVGTGCTLPTRYTGVFTQLGTGTEAAGTESSVIATLGLSNNLSQVFINTETVELSYFIPGASSQPPSTSMVLNGIINPAVNATATTGVNSTLPGSFTGGSCSYFYAQITLVPPPIREWLNFNRTALPETPFVMVATATVTGVTSAGDGLESNPSSIQIHVLTDVPIAPTGASS